MLVYCPGRRPGRNGLTGSEARTGNGTHRGDSVSLGEPRPAPFLGAEPGDLGVSIPCDLSVIGGADLVSSISPLTHV